jgi:hypothetical protein
MNNLALKIGVIINALLDTDISGTLLPMDIKDQDQGRISTGRLMTITIEAIR